MSITQYLSIALSRHRRRRLLFVLLLLYPLVGAIAFRADISRGFDLSLLFNIVQLLLVEAGLILLYRSTSKKENQRYSLDTDFYLRQYRDERHRVLALGRSETGEPEALCGISCVARPATERVPSTPADGMVISHSVLEWVPDGTTSIEAVSFELLDDWYEVPWLVAENSLDTILRRFNAMDRHDYNGLTLATHRWVSEPGRLHLQFKKSFYYNYLATNLLPEIGLSGGLTNRDLLEPGPSLSDLDTALPENHLGLSCLLRTRDGALVIPRRSQHTNVFKGQLSPSVSGAANMSTCRTSSGGYSPLAWLVRELTEELPFLATDRETFPAPLSSCLRRAEFLGMTRELRRCGKPELFFFLQLPVDASRVRELWAEHARIAGGDSVRGEPRRIDLSENAELLVVDESEVFERITTRIVQSGVVRRRGSHSVELGEGKQADVLSESLLANLIVYRLARQRSTVGNVRGDPISP